MLSASWIKVDLTSISTHVLLSPIREEDGQKNNQKNDQKNVYEKLNIE